MKMKKVSIIVPVYNAEKYIDDCVNSILNQTYSNIEVILVNDGSTDKSGLICDNYAELDNRVKVIHQKNSGPSIARNVGITVSTGDYIQFADADDLLEKDMTKILVKHMFENVQLVICGYQSIYLLENKKSSNLRYPQYLGSYSMVEFNQYFGNLYFEGFINSPCNKLYIAKLIKNNNLEFPKNINMGEDLLFNLEYFKKCNTNVYIIKDTLYKYIKISNHSLTVSYKPYLYETHKILFNKVSSYLKENNSYIRDNILLTERLYFISVIGSLNNIFHKNSDMDSLNKKNEIKKIINDNIIRKNLDFVKTQNLYKKIIGFLIKRKFVIVIYLIFKLRSQFSS
jgi:glycosyltransferase involved in cell wall biosynthesis